MNIPLLNEMGEYFAAGFLEDDSLPQAVKMARAFDNCYRRMEIPAPEDRLMLPAVSLEQATLTMPDGEALPMIVSYQYSGGPYFRWEALEAKRRAFPGAEYQKALDELAEDWPKRQFHGAGYTHHNINFPKALTLGLRGVRAEVDRYAALAAETANGYRALESAPTDGTANGTADGTANGMAGETPAPRGGAVPPELQDKLDFYKALQIFTDGIFAYHQRVVEAAEAKLPEIADPVRREEWQRMIEGLRVALIEPPRDFYEAMLTVNWLYYLDGCDNLGRFDQYMLPYWTSPIASTYGTSPPRPLAAATPLSTSGEGETAPLTLPCSPSPLAERGPGGEVAFARRLLDEMWMNLNRGGGWNVAIGGTTRDGQPAHNALTLECMKATARVHQKRPNLALRTSSETPDEVFVEALRTIRSGVGMPAIYNDDAYIPELMSAGLGLAVEDARDYCFGGCTETMVMGCSNVGSLDDDQISFAKHLELALWDGYDPVHKRQAGPHTGQFTGFASFGEFFDAVKAQITYDVITRTNATSAGQEFRSTREPRLFRSLLTDDCLARGKNMEAGGAQYNWSVHSWQGMANAADSLAAIGKCVFEDKTVSPEELLAALRDNFEGHEETWRLLKAAPKFGNNDPYVDDLAREMTDHGWTLMRSLQPWRGGRFLPSCILFVTYEGAGLQVSATPDGRRAFEVLTDSIGPAQGRDIEGPTSMFQSVTAIDLKKALGTPILNLRLMPQVMQTDEDLLKIVRLIRTFFYMGGMQIQINVVDKETLLAAQLEPEKHKDLIVRIGGYSEYFNLLSKGLQDSVIARTEHGV